MDERPNTCDVALERIRHALSASRHSQAWLADELGVSRQAVSQWLSGAQVIPARRLAQIAGLLDLDASELGAFAGYSQEEMEGLSVMVRPGVDPELVLAQADIELVALHAVGLNGLPLEVERRAERWADLMHAIAHAHPELRRPFERRRALFLDLKGGVLRETRLTSHDRYEQDSYPGTRAPRTLMTESEDVIATVLAIGTDLRIPALIGKAHLLRAHAYYVNHNSSEAIDYFWKALRYPLEEGEVMLAYRTMALAGAYVGRCDLVREMRRRVVERGKKGTYGNLHSLATAYEGIARACGLVAEVDPLGYRSDLARGLRHDFRESMDLAQKAASELLATGVHNPLLGIQQSYAQASVYAAAGSWRSVQDQLDRGLRLAAEHDYPRHWQQMMSLARRIPPHRSAGVTRPRGSTAA